MMHAMRRAMKSGLACAGLMYLTMVLSAQTASAQAPNWQTYSYSTDGFSASYPSIPDLQKKEIPTDEGTFELRAYIGTDGEVAMFVGVCDYGAAVNGRDPQTVLNGSQQGAIDNVKAHLISGQQGLPWAPTPGLAVRGGERSQRISPGGSTLWEARFTRHWLLYPLGKPYADTARFLRLVPVGRAHDTPRTGC